MKQDIEKVLISEDEIQQKYVSICFIRSAIKGSAPFNTPIANGNVSLYSLVNLPEKSKSSKIWIHL
jgi:hypothetical protein